MDDRRLLGFYLARGAPEAQRWNLSIENLSAELACRRALTAWVRRRRGMRVCNVGIGAGEWDDFLGYWLEGFGRLTSIDRDRRACEVFRYRQAREGHPNPAKVARADAAGAPAAGRFDLATLVGSTAAESGGPRALLPACLRLLKGRGRLFYMGLGPLEAPGGALQAARAAGARIERSFRSPGGAPLASFAFLARKA